MTPPPPKPKSLSELRDELADKATSKYVDDWVAKQKFAFINNTTLQMRVNFFPGFQQGFNASSAIWSAECEKLVSALEQIKNTPGLGGLDHTSTKRWRESSMLIIDEVAKEALQQFKSWKAGV